MRECRLRWFGQVLRRLPYAPVSVCENMMIEGVKRGRGRHKITWKEVISKDKKYKIKNILKFKQI